PIDTSTFVTPVNVTESMAPLTVSVPVGSTRTWPSTGRGAPRAKLLSVTVPGVVSLRTTLSVPPFWAAVAFAAFAAGAQARHDTRHMATAVPVPLIESLLQASYAARHGVNRGIQRGTWLRKLSYSVPNVSMSDGSSNTTTQT